MKSPLTYKVDTNFSLFRNKLSTVWKFFFPDVSLIISYFYLLYYTRLSQNSWSTNLLFYYSIELHDLHFHIYLMKKENMNSMFACSCFSILLKKINCRVTKAKGILKMVKVNVPNLESWPVIYTCYLYGLWSGNELKK